MPLKIDKWRGSPAVRAMHPAARSGYLDLILSQWQSDDCSISSSELDLAEMSFLGDELWTLYGVRILRNFVTLENGRLRNLVCFEEWEDAKRIFELRQASANRTNTARSPHGHRTVTDGIAPRPADTRTGTETGTVKKETTPKALPSALEFPAWLPKDAWDAFTEMRKKERHPLSDGAVKLAISKLDKMRTAGEDIRAVLEESTLKGYRGLFSLNGNGTTNGIRPPPSQASEDYDRKVKAMMAERTVRT